MVEPGLELDRAPVDSLPVTAGPFGRLRLAIEIVAVYVRVRWLVWRRGTVPAVTALRSEPAREVSSEPGDLRIRRGRRLGRVVVRVLRVLPTDSRCLMRSLVLTRILARRGIYAKVVIGVRSAPSFAAHAWVEIDGLPVLAMDERDYQRLVDI